MEKPTAPRVPRRHMPAPTGLPLFINQVVPIATGDARVILVIRRDFSAWLTPQQLGMFLAAERYDEARKW